jgi:hypothetical protein
VAGDAGAATSAASGDADAVGVASCGTGGTDCSGKGAATGGATWTMPANSGHSANAAKRGAQREQRAAMAEDKGMAAGVAEGSGKACHLSRPPLAAAISPPS